MTSSRSWPHKPAGLCDSFSASLQGKQRMAPKVQPIKFQPRSRHAPTKVTKLRDAPGSPLGATITLV